MNRVLMLIATAGVMLVGTQAIAIDPAGHSRSSRRQVMDCMTKRMSANKTVSYNEAIKACKDQMKTQSDNLASNAPIKPVNGR
jgi:hypothetical protein